MTLCGVCHPQLLPLILLSQLEGRGAARELQGRAAESFRTVNPGSLFPGSESLVEQSSWLQGISELGSQQATAGRQSGPPGIALSHQLSQELPAQLTDPSLDPSPSLLQPATSEELPLTDPALAPPFLGGDQDHHMSEGMDDIFTDWPH